MAKITRTKFMRKYGFDREVPAIKRHYEFAEYKGEKFPVFMAPGQIVNIKKAYKKWKENEKENNKESSKENKEV